MADAAFISRIQIFPVKSLDATVLQEARILPSGAIEHDRRWAMFDSNGKFVSRKWYASFHRLRSRVNIEEMTLSIGEGGGPEADQLVFSLGPDREACERWLSGFFARPVQLRNNDEAGFPDDTNAPGPTLISVATLKAVAGWFDLTFEQARLRFRTNIEIDGVPAFWEDRLFGAAGSTVRFALGDASFEGVNPCQRCAVPTRDALSGEVDAGFVARFRELRRQSLPGWAEASRFDHFYRLAINTRASGNQAGKIIRVGDPVIPADS
jgi:MOSC domain-containing protein